MKLILFILFSFIIQYSTTAPSFFDNFLTSPTYKIPTHISDFRNQPRSDSRADKIDSITANKANYKHYTNNFNNKISTGRLKRNVELYTEILGKVIDRTRDNIQRFVQNISEGDNKNQPSAIGRNVRSQKFSRTTIATTTTTTTTPTSSIITTDELNSDSNEFIGLSIDDVEVDEANDNNANESEITGNMNHANNPHVYLINVLNRIGLLKTIGHNIIKNGEKNALRSAIEFFQPLILTWNNYMNTLKMMPESMEYINIQRRSDKLQLFNDDEIIDNEGIDDDENENEDNINNNVDGEEEESTTTIPGGISTMIEPPIPPLSLPDIDTIKTIFINNFPYIFNETAKMQAKYAFQNAFNKYSELIATVDFNRPSTNNSSSDGDDDDDDDDDGNTKENNPITEKPNGNNDDDDENNIDPDNNNNIDDVNVADDETENLNPQNFGIFVLEILGTIAGLTWGAINHIQNMNQQN